MAQLVPVESWPRPLMLSDRPWPEPRRFRPSGTTWPAKAPADSFDAMRNICFPNVGITAQRLLPVLVAITRSSEHVHLVCSQTLPSML